MKIEPNVPRPIEPESEQQAAPTKGESNRDDGAVLRDRIERANRPSLQEMMEQAKEDGIIGDNMFTAQMDIGVMDDYSKERTVSGDAGSFPFFGKVGWLGYYATMAADASGKVEEGLAEGRLGGAADMGGGARVFFNAFDQSLGLPVVMIGSSYSQGAMGFLEGGIGIGKDTFVQAGAGAFVGASSTLESAVDGGRFGEAYGAVTAWVGFGAKSEFGAGYRDDRVFVDIGMGFAVLVGMEFDLAFSFNPKDLGEGVADLFASDPIYDVPQWLGELGRGIADNTTEWAYDAGFPENDQEWAAAGDYALDGAADAAYWGTGVGSVVEFVDSWF